MKTYVKWGSLLQLLAIRKTHIFAATSIVGKVFSNLFTTVKVFRADILKFVDLFLSQAYSDFLIEVHFNHLYNLILQILFIYLSTGQT